MSTSANLAGPDDERLKRLLSYVSVDPANESLRRDAAERALEIGAPETARGLLEDSPHDLGHVELNLMGISEMQLRNFSKAAELFEALIARGVDDAAVKFNLAWSLAMEKRFEDALQLLTEEVASALPPAATLQVQLLHELGDFDAAAEAARRHTAAFPDHEGLAAAVSVLALDIEDLELARACAQKAGSHPDALTTLGTLAVGEQQVDKALELFESALRSNDTLPRAWVGRGLARMLTKHHGASADLDRGAELFEDHIGSWIAAGWAHLIAGDQRAARDRFERALSIDDNFGESHGSLAVIDALEGRDADAAKRIAVATRLNRECFSAGFAQTLLKARAGDADAAQAMFQKILETPVNEQGDTVAAALARMGLR